MIEKTICFVSCVLCAIPFMIISKYDKDSSTPVGFWAGDTSLKDKVKNVKEYNIEMAALYKKCVYAFLLTGVGFLVMPVVGYILLCFDCTIGIYIVWRYYKKILKRYL